MNWSIHNKNSSI